ncbi:MAG: hypothetical protein LLF97_07675 [Planctomycetaceae bacterium]|nr:hypothetical protein [Planctomycetaceae bacterium]
MKNVIKIAMTVVLSLVAVDAAQACYCGAARWAVCRRACCCESCTGCTTVMRTCQKVVYQPRQYTCYRTCYEPVCEQKTVTAVRYVPETRYRSCVQTVCRPVYETVEREFCYTVCRPVTSMQTVKVCCGRWEMRNVECCASNPCDPCGPAVKTTRQCRVWVPQVVEKQVACVRYVTETVKKKVPCTVCRMVSEQRTLQVPYTVCKAENYQTTVSCVRYVAKQVPYTVTRCEPQVVTTQEPVQVCCPAACQ